MKVGIGVGLAGRFSVEKRNRNGDITWSSEFDNLVLDVGWDNFKQQLIDRASHPMPNYLYLGTGTSEPQATDSGLEKVSETLPGKLRTHPSDDEYEDNEEDRWAQVTKKFKYEEGEAEGVWTELGLAYGSDYDAPYNRSLIRDQNGDPVSLTILSDEYLTVYVQLRLYFGDATGEGSFDYNGETIDYTLSHGSTFYNDMLEEGTNYMNFNYTGSSSVGRGWQGDNMEQESGTTKFLTPLEEIEPGEELVYERLKLGGQYANWVLVDFSPSFTVPSDHKLTIQQHSIEFFRDTGAIPA